MLLVEALLNVPGVGSTVVAIANMVVIIRLVVMNSAAGEDNETPEGEFGDLSELVITVLVVSIASKLMY